MFLYLMLKPGLGKYPQTVVHVGFTGYKQMVIYTIERIFSAFKSRITAIRFRNSNNQPLKQF